MRACWLSLIVFLWSWTAQADPVLLQGAGCCDPRQDIRVLSDPGGALSFSQVRNLQADFQMPLREDLSYGYRSGAIWLYLQVKSTERARWWWLFTYPSLDHLTLYIENSHGIRQFDSGDMVALSSRALVHRQAVFPLDLAADEVTTLWLRVESQGSMTLQNQLINNDEFISLTADAYLAPALYFGALLALAGYNLLLFLVLREKVFLWYVLFVLWFGVGSASLNGIGAIYLWPGALELSNRLLPLGFTVAALMAVLFTRAFLDTARFSPAWDKLLRPLSTLMLVAVGFAAWMPVQQALIVMSLIGIVAVLALTLCAIQSVLNRAPGARLFALAWAMLLLGTIVMSLRNLGLLPSNFFTINAMQLGSALEMLLVSFGLAARFNQLKLQHSQAQQQALDAQQQLVQQLREHENQLAQKVAERTAELEQMNEKLQRLATTDPLTGLANRNAMYQQLSQAMARAKRQGSSLALLYLDLDGFKTVNDQFGHLAGDKVLFEVSERLRDAVRETDLICRIGGDEFLLICEGLTQGAILVQLTERLLQHVQQPFYHGTAQIRLGVSIGVAISSAGETAAEALIDAADRAMYDAKAAGKNCVQLASDFA
ncbi:diguanylate cyclase [Rheinheimera texasensis]|uniref:diguanylate cyclase n=1 Tax=Rheinheimera texasensis TaxID=306205 RepID=UPI0032B1D62E